MNTAILTPPAVSAEAPPLAAGVAVGLAAASIGALYTVYARWGIASGLHASDLTAMRFGVAGVLMLPLLLLTVHRRRHLLTDRWRLWLAVAALAGTPFGLLMFGALRFAPASHAAVFPFAAMSVAGLLLSAWVLGDRFTLRKGTGIAVVLGGLVVLSGVDASSFSGQALLGDTMFIAAGTLWAGFGILLRRNRLDPLLATAVISVSALLTYVPAYIVLEGFGRWASASASVLWTELLVQGVIAGTGTLFTYATMVRLLGPARAAVFPALAPGLAALMAWPVLGHVPTPAETTGLFIVMAGLVLAVTTPSRKSA
jgi:drug/metabolite transporter (DMT)-like permease